MSIRPETRAERNTRWIEKNCRIPTGPNIGEYAALSSEQNLTLHRVYDSSDLDVLSTGAISDTDLSAYIVLLHVCGPEAKPGRNALPALPVSSAAIVWAAAAAPALREALEFEDGAIVNSDLRIGWMPPPAPAAAWVSTKHKPDEVPPLPEGLKLFRAGMVKRPDREIDTEKLQRDNPDVGKTYPWAAWNNPKSPDT